MIALSKSRWDITILNSIFRAQNVDLACFCEWNFNFLKFISKHHRKVLNGPRMFLGHQRDVLDPWWHLKSIFLKKILTWKSPYRHHFWLGLLWSYRNASKMSILRMHNSNFLEASKRCMPPPFQAERPHNHPKSLYCTDFWISPLLTFKL